MAILTYTFGVRFRKGFRTKMLAHQAGMDRYAYNQLLETLKKEYHNTGRVDTGRGRTNAWYTKLRNETGPRWLKQSVSGMTRQTLHDLGRHYSQYVEAERRRAAGAGGGIAWGEPHFKRRGGRISLPLTITHDNTRGQARFAGERTIRISKMGDINLSRPFPIPNYRPKTARLFQTSDGAWRIAIACEVEDAPPPSGEPSMVGVDRNVGNISTPYHTIEPPPKMARRIRNAEKAAGRAQRIAARRQKPSRQESGRRPGSNRWAKAAKRAARNRRRAADLRRTIAHKESRVLADKHTHVALERLAIPNMTHSAKGTVENPGRNIRQKSGLNRSILSQNWGMLALFLQYKLSGGIIWVDPRHTSQACHMCGAADRNSRRGRAFACTSCGHVCHADRNAAFNIEKRGMQTLGMPHAHVKGRLDAEGSCACFPMNRQAPTGAWPSGTVTLWHDV